MELELSGVELEFEPRTRAVHVGAFSYQSVPGATSPRHMQSVDNGVGLPDLSCGGRQFLLTYCERRLETVRNLRIFKRRKLGRVCGRLMRAVKLFPDKMDKLQKMDNS